MVSSIIPGTTGAGALGVDPRYARQGAAGAPPQAPANQSHRGDSVEIGDAAAWRAARESVRQGIAQLNEALTAGRDVYGLLGKISSLAHAPDAEGAQAELDDTLEKLRTRVDAAISQGARLLAGDDLAVQAEPGAPGVLVHGIDLRIKASPGYGDPIAVALDADLSDPAALAQAAQRSIDALQTGMDRLVDAARALDALQGFLSAAEGAVTGVRGDLDADAARLTALQVRQGLSAAGAASIANVEPQAVLSLFRT